MKLVLLGIFSTFIVSHIISVAQAADRKWFVAVYGENYEHVVGASLESTVMGGKFIDDSFVGKEMFVKIKSGYSLTQYYSEPEIDSNPDSAITTASDAATNSTQESEPISEFGPLIDTGLQYVLDGEFYGWGCSELFVTHLGDNVYHLRCDDEMRHSG